MTHRYPSNLFNFVDLIEYNVTDETKRSMMFWINESKQVKKEKMKSLGPASSLEHSSVCKKGKIGKCHPAL